VDTGDAITALARDSGTRGALNVMATALLERLSLATAAHVVVRGTAHQEWLARRGVGATLVPDGVDTSLFRPGDKAAARRRLSWPDGFTMTIVGSTVWNPRYEMAYGWDLVEVLALVRDLPVRGVLVGDGTGLPHLDARAAALGVRDRLLLAGRLPLAALPDVLTASDVCLSTQSNDLVGQVRTTGKLPLYLACGKYVLASAVGEAARVLPPPMLVPYDGVKDPAYPARLAARVRDLVAAPGRLDAGLTNVVIARSLFDYDVLAPRLEAVLREVITRKAA
jgi:glycosyltransferase involved in cell wall biosynthesis